MFENNGITKRNTVNIYLYITKRNTVDYIYI